MKRFITLLIPLSWFTLLPTLVVTGMSMTGQLLIGLSICHLYNGRDFGSSALCIIPQINYFNGLFLLSGAYGIPLLINIAAIIGTLSIIAYFALTYLDNKWHQHGVQKFSKWMIILAAIVGVPLFFSFFFS